MQLVALDANSPLIASKALKHKSYRCPECLGQVRLRSGPRRQPHYYHVAASKGCRQQGKSAEHLQAQLKLYSLLPEGECSLERPFPSIGRIGDVVWEPAQLIFEIQCSPISQEEVEARTKDYGSVGMRVIWILHDKKFNLNKLSAAEHHLRSQTCYYTNISSVGSGLFYDQFEILKNPYRLFKGPRLPIALNRPLPIKRLCAKSPLQLLAHRAALWQLSFEGDLINRLTHAPEKSISALMAIEKKFQLRTPQRLRKLPLAFKRLYALILNGLVRACSSGDA